MERMLQKKGLILFSVLLAIVLLIPLLNSCQQQGTNDADRIFGKRWGSNLREYPELTFLAQDGETKYYTKEDDTKKLSETDINNIVYGFYQDHLYSVLVYFDSVEKFSKIKDAFAQQYGTPYQPDESARKYFWSNNKVSLLLSYDDTSNQGRVSYFFLPIQNQIEENSTKKLDKSEAK